jgi:hypothetical protein
MITTELWEQMNKKYLLEQEAIKRKLQAHLSANERYYEDGIRILELAQHAHILYKTQVFPNSGNLWISYFRTAS